MPSFSGFFTDFFDGCMPSKVELEKAQLTFGDGHIMDEGFPVPIEDPPPSTARGPGPMSATIEPDTTWIQAPWIQVPRHGKVPVRKNFLEAGSCEKKLEVDFSGLQDPAWERRREAVAGLGSCSLGRHPAEFDQDAANVIMPALRAAMRDDHWEVRAQAATSLSDLGPEAVWHAVPVLWETCSDPEERVRQAALHALQANGQEPPPQRMRQPRLRFRSWQEPPSLMAVREDPHEDCQSECPIEQAEDLSTTANSGGSSRQSSQISSGGSEPAWVTSKFTMSVGKSLGDELDLDALGDDLEASTRRKTPGRSWCKKELGLRRFFHRGGACGTGEFDL